MDIDQQPSAVCLSTHQGQVHRCTYNCSITHVLGNLYQCKDSGATHVCDFNCDQRIVYDSHSSICRASRKILPLSSADVVRGVRRGRCEEDGGTLRSKRSRDLGGCIPHLVLGGEYWTEDMSPV
ncbi:hypothetical protein KFL_000430090 [Klebsormidium nitens]|uniref:Uncharacterized protein n=1 Tax=Klebsormidium nitens TaxID=105231 RepID=A0A1Y1HTV1_KLENI|nr:hypothetical protein KFL_000430090 [Klebsormidium nitens]|eukprot:GAQ79967.1 hypothetical protein KFL_000430090 [Klebsormidium nitens]